MTEPVNPPEETTQENNFNAWAPYPKSEFLADFKYYAGLAFRTLYIVIVSALIIVGIDKQSLTDVLAAGVLVFVARWVD